MEKTILGLKISYNVLGEGRPLLLLHGWGVDSTVFAAMGQHFSQYMRVWTLDFPGFGGSAQPDSVWGVEEYADFVEKFCGEMSIEAPSILGHSFGGRVCIVLGSRGFGSKLILTDAAGILPKRSFKYYLRVYSYKAAKGIMSLPLLKPYYDKAMSIWQKNNPSSDYAKTEGIMRPIFVRVVNQDLEPLLPKIQPSTLLLWGENDTATPLSDGQTMERKIPDAGLVVFKGCGHYPFLEQSGYFHRVMESFLGIESN